MDVPGASQAKMAGAGDPPFRRPMPLFSVAGGALAAAAQTCALLTSEVEDPLRSSWRPTVTSASIAAQFSKTRWGILAHAEAALRSWARGESSRAEVGGLLEHLEPALRGLLGAVSVSIASEE